MDKTCLFKKEISCCLNCNIIKTRDDVYPVCLEHTDDGTFSLCEHHPGCSWCDSYTSLDNKVLRERIEPWLTSLFQSEHLSLLVGSGLTTGICEIAKQKSTGMTQAVFTHFGKEIEEEVTNSAHRLNRADGNFEDSIRIANELLAGLTILKDKNAEKLQEEIDDNLLKFATSLLQTEEKMVLSPESNEAFNCLIAFLMSFASRTGTRDRLNIFTTNYDRLIEEAADLAGMHLLDRFVGKMSPVFRASRLNLDLHYNPPGIRGEPRYLEGVAHFTKLHGSLDWVQAGTLIRKIGLPFGAKDVAPYLQAPGLDGATAFNLMIYPNSMKDRETAEYPYVELFRDFAAAVCRPNSTVVTYGYSFGDEHINRVLRDMLTIPSTHLVIISYNDPLGRIPAFYHAGHTDQISLLIGPNVAEIQTLTQQFLPKSSIDFATSRMGELLKARLATKSEKGEESSFSADKETPLEEKK